LKQLQTTQSPRDPGVAINSRKYKVCLLPGVEAQDLVKPRWVLIPSSVIKVQSEGTLEQNQEIRDTDGSLAVV